MVAWASASAGRLGAAVQLQGAAAARPAGRVHLPALGRQHPDRGRVDVVESARWRQPCMNATRPRAGTGGRGRGDHGQPPQRGAAAGVRGQRGQRAHRAATGPGATEPAQAQRRAAPAAAPVARTRPGWVKAPSTAAVKSRSASRRGTWRSSCGPDLLDQPVVLDPGRAGGHAGHAAQAAVEVQPHVGARRPRRARGRSASARSGPGASPSRCRTPSSSGRWAGRIHSGRSP